MLGSENKGSRHGVSTGVSGRVSRRHRFAPPVVSFPTLFFALATLALCISNGVLAQNPAPPRATTRPVAIDTPNDVGERITLRWSLSADDHPGGAGLTAYEVWRAKTPGGPFQKVAAVPPGFSEAIDAQGLENGVPYFYRIVAVRGTERDSSDVSTPAIARAQWFHRGRLNCLVAVVVLSFLIIYFIEHARKGGKIFIRKIAGLDAVDEAVGRATEMGRKILYIPGTSDMDNVQTLAGIAILERVARMTAEYDTSLEVPVSRSLVMVACRETVKEAYLATGRPDSYSDAMVYYLTDDQFGYAAALEGIMVRDKPATIFMQGSFYAEALIMAETGNSIGAIQIAGTAQASQLPFFVAACDYTLIGEELFVAGAYLSKEPRQLGSLKGQDLGKAIILVLLLVGIVIQTAGIFDFASLFEVQ
jgi:hypothetical protein